MCNHRRCGGEHSGLLPQQGRGTFHAVPAHPQHNIQCLRVGAREPCHQDMAQVLRCVLPCSVRWRQGGGSTLPTAAPSMATASRPSPHSPGCAIRKLRRRYRRLCRCTCRRWRGSLCNRVWRSPAPWHGFAAANPTQGRRAGAQN